MSILKCFECGHEVQEHAEVCPNCGCPVVLTKDKANKFCYYNVEYDFKEVKKLLDNDRQLAAIELISNEYKISRDEALEITEVIKMNHNQIPYDYIEFVRGMSKADRETLNQKIVKMFS